MLQQQDLPLLLCGKEGGTMAARCMRKPSGSTSCLAGCKQLLLFGDRTLSQARSADVDP